MFPWRRYPRRLALDRATPSVLHDAEHARILAALRGMDSFIDITEDDLLHLLHIVGTVSAATSDQQQTDRA